MTIMMPPPIVAAGVIVDSMGREWDPTKHPRDRKGKFIHTLRMIRAFLTPDGTTPWATGEVSMINPDGSIRMKVNKVSDTANNHYIGAEVDVTGDKIENINEKARLGNNIFGKPKLGQSNLGNYDFSPEATKMFVDSITDDQDESSFIEKLITETTAASKTGKVGLSTQRGRMFTAMYAKSVSGGPDGEGKKHSDAEYMALLEDLGVPPDIIDDTPDGMSGLKYLMDQENAEHSPDNTKMNYMSWFNYIPPTDPDVLMEVRRRDSDVRVQWYKDGSRAIVWPDGTIEQHDKNQGDLLAAAHAAHEQEGTTPDGKANTATKAVWAESEISDAEFKSVKYYMGGGYKPLNEALRGEEPLDEVDTKIVAALDGFIDKNELAEDKVVFRGLSEKKGHEAEFLQLRDSLVSGAVISDKGFMSTSTNEGSADGFTWGFAFNEGQPGVKFEIEAPKGTRALDVDSNGKIKSGESEIIFPRGTQLEIISNELSENGLVNIVRARVIQDDKPIAEIPDSVDEPMQLFDKAGNPIKPATPDLEPSQNGWTGPEAGQYKGAPLDDEPTIEDLNEDPELDVPTYGDSGVAVDPEDLRNIANQTLLSDSEYADDFAASLNAIADGIDDDQLDGPEVRKQLSDLSDEMDDEADANEDSHLQDLAAKVQQQANLIDEAAPKADLAPDNEDPWANPPPPPEPEPEPAPKPEPPDPAGPFTYGDTTTQGKPDIDEKSAVQGYQQSWHHTINKALRKGTQPNGEAQKRIDLLDHLLERSTTDRDLKLYRGLRPDGIGVDQELFNDFVASLKVGTTFEDKGFVSTTRNLDEANKVFASTEGGKHQAVLFELDLPAGSNGFDVTEFNKKNQFYANFAEEEILLPRGQKFEVLGLVDDDQGRKIVKIRLTDEDAVPAAPDQSSLTPTQKKSLKEYIEASWDINSTIRTNDDDTNWVGDMAEITQSLDAITKSDTIPSTEVLYRGISNGDGDKDYDKFIASLQPGAVISDKAYLSTSTDEFLARTFMMDDATPESPGVMFEITALGDKHSGFYIDGNPEFTNNEHEWLLPRNTQIKIDFVEKLPDGNYRVVGHLLEEDGYDPATGKIHESAIDAEVPAGVDTKPDSGADGLDTGPDNGDTAPGGDDDAEPDGLPGGSSDEAVKKFEVLPPEQQGKSGDGYASKSGDSMTLWGKYGASGVMVRHVDDNGTERFLLVQRGPHLVGKNQGKWQLAGGALNEKETDQQGAARELTEELSPPEGFLDGLTQVGEVNFKHESGWHYNNLAADAPEQFEPKVDGYETGDAKWFTREEIAKLSLHPALEKNLDDLFAQFSSSGPSAPDTIPDDVLVEDAIAQDLEGKEFEAITYDSDLDMLIDSIFHELDEDSGSTYDVKVGDYATLPENWKLRVGIHENLDSDGNSVRRWELVDPDGSVVETYSTSHLFGPDVVSGPDEMTESIRAHIGVDGYPADEVDPEVELHKEDSALDEPAVEASYSDFPGKVGLTPQEQAALNLYGYSVGYRLINPYLHHDKHVFDTSIMAYRPATSQEIAKAEEAIKGLDSAFEKAKPTDKSMLVYRRTGPELFSEDDMTGESFTNLAYTSTATKLTSHGYGYESKPVFWEITLPTGTKAMQGNAHENEVLLPRGGKFTVTSDVTDDNGVRHLKVTYHPADGSDADNELPMEETEKEKELSPEAPVSITVSGGPVTEEELAAVDRYTSTDHIDINNGLRDPDADMSEWEDHIDVFDGLINRSTTDDDMVTYRGLASNGMYGDDDDGEASFNEFMDKVKPGAVVQDLAYLSTTRDKNIAEKFTKGGTVEKPGVIFAINVPKGSNAYDVGITAEAYEGVGGAEKEIILPRGTKLRIDSIEDMDDGKKLVSATVVDEDADSLLPDENLSPTDGESSEPQVAPPTPPPTNAELSPSEPGPGSTDFANMKDADGPYRWHPNGTKLRVGMKVKSQTDGMEGEIVRFEKNHDGVVVKGTDGKKRGRKIKKLDLVEALQETEPSTQAWVEPAPKGVILQNELNDLQGSGFVIAEFFNDDSLKSGDFIELPPKHALVYSADTDAVELRDEDGITYESWDRSAFGPTFDESDILAAVETYIKGVKPAGSIVKGNGVTWEKLDDGAWESNETGEVVYLDNHPPLWHAIESLPLDNADNEPLKVIQGNPNVPSTWDGWDALAPEQKEEIEGFIEDFGHVAPVGESEPAAVKVKDLVESLNLDLVTSEMVGDTLRFWASKMGGEYDKQRMQMVADKFDGKGFDKLTPSKPNLPEEGLAEWEKNILGYNDPQHIYVDFNNPNSTVNINAWAKDVADGKIAAGSTVTLEGTSFKLSHEEIAGVKYFELTDEETSEIWSWPVESTHWGDVAAKVEATIIPGYGDNVADHASGSLSSLDPSSQEDLLAIDGFFSNPNLHDGDFLLLPDGYIISHDKDGGTISLYNADNNKLATWKLADYDTEYSTTDVATDIAHYTGAGAPGLGLKTLSDLDGIRKSIPMNVPSVKKEYPGMSDYQAKQYRNAGYALNDMMDETPESPTWFKAFKKAEVNLKNSGPLGSAKLAEIQSWYEDVTGEIIPGKASSTAPAYAFKPGEPPAGSVVTMSSGTTWTKHPDGSWHSSSNNVVVHATNGGVSTKLDQKWNDQQASAVTSVAQPGTSVEHNGTLWIKMSNGSWNNGYGAYATPGTIGYMDLEKKATKDTNNGDASAVQLYGTTWTKQNDGSWVNGAGDIVGDESGDDLYDELEAAAKTQLPAPAKPAATPGDPTVPIGKVIPQYYGHDYTKQSDGTWTSPTGPAVEPGSDADLNLNEYAKDPSKTPPDKVVQTKPGKYLPDAKGDAIFIGSKVQSNSDGLIGTVVAFEKNGTGIVVLGEDGKKRGRKAHKMYNLDADASPYQTSQAMPNHVAPVAGSKPLVKTYESDPDSPWFNKPKPQQPAPLAEEEMSGPDDAWWDEVEKLYKERRKNLDPNWTEKPLVNSATYSSYAPVKTGSITHLDALLSSQRITPELHAQALEQIMEKSAGVLEKQNKHAELMKQWREDSKAWRKANGMPTVSLRGMDEGVIKWGNDGGNYTAMKAWMNKNQRAGALGPNGLMSQDAKNAVSDQKGSNISYALRPLKEKSLDASEVEMLANSSTIFAGDKAMLESPPVAEDFITIRTFEINAFKNPDTGESFKLNENISSIVGSIQHDWGFAETSPGSTDAGASPGYSIGNVVMDLRVPAGTRGVWTLTPGFLTSNMPSERGFILERGIAYYIHSAEKIGSKWYVKAEIIPKNEVSYDEFGHFVNENPFFD